MISVSQTHSSPHAPDVVERHRTVACWLFLVLIALSGCGGVYPSEPAKPLIGITTVYNQETHRIEVSANYVDAIARTGGIPVVLPALNDPNIIERYVETLDGLVLVGGRDIPPTLYGQTAHETAVPIPERRVSFERGLIAQWMASNKPILGVCLGMQFTNVVMGGTMIQDIPSQVGKSVTHREAYHPVTIDPNSELADVLDSETAEVLSWHHQAVDKLGTGLKPVAWAEDGMVEALERTDGGPGLFIQWHPEMMADRDLEHTNAIYGYLVKLSQQSLQQ